MPELPEVETIRNGLKKKVLREPIIEVVLLNGKVTKNSPDEFLKIVKNNSFEDILRIGKLLIFKFSKGEKFLLIHLRMTGRLVYREKNRIVAGGHTLAKGQTIKGFAGDLPDAHTGAVFKFRNGGELFFNDARRFGYLHIVDQNDLQVIKSRFGPEPLSPEFSLDKFREILKGRKMSIKAVLLNQKNIAGLGNIYADESLFDSRIKPQRTAGSLSPDEVKRLWNSINRVIEKAIEFRGTSFSDYVDHEGKKGSFLNLLKVYGRTGKKCFGCSGSVKKIKFAGRGTHYCPSCQT